MDIASTESSCPVKKLQSYKKGSDIVFGGIKLIVLEKLGFGKGNYAIHTRRSLQKTFLKGAIDTYRSRSISLCNSPTGTSMEKSELTYFWKTALSEINQQSKIQEIENLIWRFQSALESYKNESEMGTYGKANKFNAKVLSLVGAVPNSMDEINFITNLALIVLIAFRIHYGSRETERNENEKNKLLKLINSIIASFLTLQKQPFNNAVLAFMEQVDIDDSGKQIFPIEFIGTNKENPTWQFTEGFKKSMKELMLANSYSEYHSKIITGCPAVQHGLLQLLAKQVLEILY